MVTVLYDYEAQNHEELTIREGTVLFVVDDYSDPEWWLAREKIDDAFGEAKEGLVPSTYIEDVRLAGGLKFF